MTTDFETLWQTLAPAARLAKPGSTFGRAPTQGVPSARTLATQLPLVELSPSGDFALGDVIGEGGMGIVHVGEQRALGRHVAIKTVRPGLSGDVATQALLLQEAIIAGALEHPNIVPIHLLGRDASGAPVLVMKRVVGESWEALISDDSHPAWTSFGSLGTDHIRSHVEILMQVANAVGFAHARGVLHRDIKPDNVLVGAFGEVHLADWGVAAKIEGLTFEGLVGTPQFLAPELVDESLPQGPWTDVYLLGATLHYVLTRTPRHPAANLHGTLMSAWVSKPVAYAADVPLELGALANRATARDPAERPQSAAEFRRALSAFLSHQASAALATSARARLDERPTTLDTEDAVERAFRAATEARFGFLTAKREWPESPEAARGLRDALGAIVEVDVARGNLSSARAHLAEIEPPSAELERLVQHLEERLASQREEQARLRGLARDIDPTFKSGARLALILLVVSMGVVVSVFARQSDTDGANVGSGAKRLVLIISGLVAAVGVFTFVARRRLFVNAAGRRVTLALLLTMGAMLLNRYIGWIDGRPIVATLRGDMLIGSLGLTLVGLFAARAWLIGGALLAFGAGLSLLWPSHAGDIFGALASLSLGLVALLERRQRSGATFATTSSTSSSGSGSGPAPR